MDRQARQAAREMWAMGDYALLAERLSPAAAQIAGCVGPGTGRRALDVAAGTGSLAIELGHLDWSVAATDVTPSLVEQGRQLTHAAGLEVDWYEASLDDQPFGDGSFDLVGSSFGLIFALDPPASLREMHRVLKGGGRIAVTSWTTTSYIADMTDVMAEFMPIDVPMDRPFQWGVSSILHDWLADGFVDPESSVRHLPWTFGDVDQAIDFLFTNSPGHVAATRTAGPDGPAMRDAARDHLAGLVGGNGRVDIEAEYLLTTARAR